MIHTIILAGLTAAVTTSIILGAVATFIERVTRPASRGPREEVADPSPNPYRTLTDDELVMGVDPDPKLTR